MTLDSSDSYDVRLDDATDPSVLFSLSRQFARGGGGRGSVISAGAN